MSPCALVFRKSDQTFARVRGSQIRPGIIHYFPIDSWMMDLLRGRPATDDAVELSDERSLNHGQSPVATLARSRHRVEVEREKHLTGVSSSLKKTSSEQQCVTWVSIVRVADPWWGFGVQTQSLQSFADSDSEAEFDADVAADADGPEIVVAADVWPGLVG